MSQDTGAAVLIFSLPFIWFISLVVSSYKTGYARGVGFRLRKYKIDKTKFRDFGIAVWTTTLLCVCFAILLTRDVAAILLFVVAATIGIGYCLFFWIVADYNRPTAQTIRLKEFEKVLDSYDSLFLQYGFERSGAKTYNGADNVELEFTFDPWGWNRTKGAGFEVKLTSDRRALDITPAYLQNNNLLTEEHIAALYRGWPKSVIVNVDGGFWFRYYNADDLEELLEALLPSILKMAEKWRTE
jgi:hypothetical protein